MAVPIFTQNQINRPVLISEPTVLPEVEVIAKREPTNTNPDAESYVDLPNPLLAYPSYTYSLSLHLLSKDDWNNIQETGEYTATNVLIASAGRYDNYSFIRNQNFRDDFYFENLNITTIIGPTEGNTSTNAIDFKFSIIEPYGVTLLDRIIDANNELIPPEPNYLESVYMLQIDFYGSDDAANLVHPIPNQTKYIPIRILSMDISVTNKGSEYQLSAVPYGHTALMQTVQQTPANFEITADTVEQFFAVQGSKEQSTDERAAESTSGYGNGSVYKVKSYASAVNAFNEKLKENKDVAIPDVIDFVFDDEIAKAKIVEKGKLPPKWAPYSDLKDKQAISKGDLTKLSANIDFNIKTYAINTGSSIESVLYFVIKNSSYILNQIVNPADFNGDLSKYIAAKKNLENEPFWWFKIIPKVTLLDYDPIRKKRGKKIVYYVKKYAIRNVKVDFSAGGKASKPIKVYNYIYTGLNRDVLELDIKFNAAFYTAVTTNAGKMLTEQGAADSAENEAKLDYSGQQSPNAIQPMQQVPLVSNQQNQATGQSLTGKSVLAGDAVKSILNNSQGDMISVSLRITGDPMYIKQDDLFYPPVSNEPVDQMLTENNSIKTDNTEMYVQVSFNAPTDLDESTAPQMRYDPKYARSLFSGMYRVLTVDSEFQRGQFTQRLELVRLPNQPTLDYVSGGTKDSAASERALDITDVPVSNQNIFNADANFSSSLSSMAKTAESSISQKIDLSLPTLNDVSSGVQNQFNSFSSVLQNAPTVSINNQNEPDLIAPPTVG